MIENNTENSNKNKRLGRGISSLLGANQFADQTQTPALKFDSNLVSTEKGDRIEKIGVEKLKPGQFQPRKTFEKSTLEELASSIKNSGILQPIIVRKSHPGYEIIAGERRWRAAQIAGLHEVPVVIKEISDLQSLEFGIIENVQRENLNPIEEAEAYQELAEKFNLSQIEIAEKVGKERSTVTNTLRLLNLPMEVRELLLKSELSAGHAKVLLSLESKQEVIKLAKNCSQQKWSVRKLETEIKKAKSITLGLKSKDSKNGEMGSQEIALLSVQDQIAKKLKTKVTISSNIDGSGKIEILYYSIEQLNNIVEELRS